MIQGLRAAGIKAQGVKRGLDHGVWASFMCGECGFLLPARARGSAPNINLASKEMMGSSVAIPADSLCRSLQSRDESARCSNRTGLPVQHRRRGPALPSRRSDFLPPVGKHPHHCLGYGRPQPSRLGVLLWRSSANAVHTHFRRSSQGRGRMRSSGEAEEDGGTPSTE